MNINIEMAHYQMEMDEIELEMSHYELEMV